MSTVQFIGPLTLEQQRWADEVQAVDAAASIFEPLSQVLRRREEHIGTYWSDSALLFLTADERAWPSAQRAVAEARAVAWLRSNDAAGCLDCLLERTPCAQHRPAGSDRHRSRPHERPSGFQPEWRRFGSGAAG